METTATTTGGFDPATALTGISNQAARTASAAAECARIEREAAPARAAILDTINGVVDRLQAKRLLADYLNRDRVHLLNLKRTPPSDWNRGLEEFVAKLEENQKAGIPSVQWGTADEFAAVLALAKESA